ncbi:DUF397 domain-containing protein [Sphaerisporangium sp. NPDC051011]|uniref:DUF397 domain-containing protein n=1 Tax=Sphaerisporangium sp. NPDC051011 TaxID=3155792 RepID=UPI0033C8E3FF
MTEPTGPDQGMGAEMDDLSKAKWVKSSYSGGNGGDCVELAAVPGAGMAIRDSKRPHGPVLCLTAAEWDAFRRGVKAGAFDDMTA